MAQRNYGFEKRQKELARKQKKEEKKRNRALNRDDAQRVESPIEETQADGTTEVVPAPAE